MKRSFFPVFLSIQGLLKDRSITITKYWLQFFLKRSQNNLTWCMEISVKHQNLGNSQEEQLFYCDICRQRVYRRLAEHTKNDFHKMFDWTERADWETVGRYKANSFREWSLNIDKKQQHSNFPAKFARKENSSTCAKTKETNSNALLKRKVCPIISWGKMSPE